MSLKGLSSIWALIFYYFRQSQGTQGKDYFNYPTVQVRCPGNLHRKAHSTQLHWKPKQQVFQIQIQIPVSLRPDLHKWIASAGHHALNKQTLLADTQLPVGFWWVRLAKAAKSNDQQLLS